MSEIKYSGFFYSFSRSSEKNIDPQGPMYTKVSWLEGNFSAGLPTRPHNYLTTCFKWLGDYVIGQWPYKEPLGSLAESSLSQLRVSGGMGTKVPRTYIPHPTSFEIYIYSLCYLYGTVKQEHTFILSPYS
jgi:hypothetical protein